MQERSRESAPQQCQNPPKGPTPSSSSSVPSSSNPSSGSGKQSRPSDQKSVKPADSGKVPSSTPPKPNLEGKLDSRGRLTQQERQRRIDHKLCLFCGKPGHRVPECNLAKASSAKGRASTVSDSSNGFPIFPITPMILRLIDGSSPGMITHATNVSIRFSCGTVHKIRFLLTKLDSDFPAVLGLDWLTLHNPLIDWVDSSVTFRDRIVILPVPVSVSAKAPIPVEIPSVPEPPPDIPFVPKPLTAPKISLVSAAAFMRSICSEGAQCYSISVHDPVEAAGRSASASATPSDSDLDGVPEIYHEFLDVFSKGKASTLADHREY
ncbi:hypothetical protein BYT27DRAFT_7093634, partial [Phlegmacium glaucopus]